MTRPVTPIEDWLTRPGGIADTLGAARRSANLTGAQLAAENGWPTSKVSKIENGKQRPTADDIKAWMRTCHATERQVRAALSLLDEVDTQHQDWRRRMRAGQVAIQTGYNHLVRDAAAVRSFSTVYVPGLLQTPAYARYPIAAGVRLHGASGDDIDAAVATRMQRQHYLYDTTTSFEFLLAEPVLRWLICPAEVMLGQLDRLQAVAASGMPNVRLGVLPMGVQLSTTPQHAYTVYVGSPQGDVALAETYVGETAYTGEDAGKLGQILDWLWEDAAEGDEARRLITDAAEQVRRSLG